MDKKEEEEEIIFVEQSPRRSTRPRSLPQRFVNDIVLKNNRKKSNRSKRRKTVDAAKKIEQQREGRNSVERIINGKSVKGTFDDTGMVQYSDIKVAAEAETVQQNSKDEAAEFEDLKIPHAFNEIHNLSGVGNDTGETEIKPNSSNIRVVLEQSNINREFNEELKIPRTFNDIHNLSDDGIVTGETEIKPNSSSIRVVIEQSNVREFHGIAVECMESKADISRKNHCTNVFPQADGAESNDNGLETIAGPNPPSDEIGTVEAESLKWNPDVEASTSTFDARAIEGSSNSFSFPVAVETPKGELNSDDEPSTSTAQAWAAESGTGTELQ